MSLKPIYPLITYQETEQIYCEIYVESPTKFIIDNWNKLLPNYQFYPKNLVIFLFLSDILVVEEALKVTEEKQRLKEEFLKLANKIQLACQQQNKSLAIIDPQDGKPLNSVQGDISFDIVAVVHQLLGLSVNNQGGCKVLNHPMAETAVYPSLLLSDAGRKEIKSLIEEILF